MSHSETTGSVSPRVDPRRTRREVLQAGSLAALGTSFARAPASTRTAPDRPGRARGCIMLLMVGGPSQVDTFDPKPEAPSEIRGPFRAIKTNVPGIRISELFPRTARHADKFAIIRSMHHAESGVHEAGLQLLQTGRRFDPGDEPPHWASVIGHLRGPKSELPPWVMLPRPIGAIGGNLPTGQTAGLLGPNHDPFVCRPDSPGAWTGPGGHDAFALNREPQSLREAYGSHRFGQSCLLARRLIEHGVSCVTINMYATLRHQPTWDMHGTRPSTGFDGYRDHVGPTFDRAYATLLADLGARGLLEETLVVAAGEFGRTPRINRRGGRDHWPGCWSILLAGGGVQGGRVVGASDAIGAYPVDRPTTPAEVVATIYHGLGIDPERTLTPPGGEPFALVEPGVEPIRELMAGRYPNVA